MIFNLLNFDIEKVIFKEGNVNREYGITTLYFIAPKEWIEGTHPEAEHAEISVELPMGCSEAEHALVMISPTKKGRDYEWMNLNLKNEEIGALIDLARIEVRRNELSI
jgi:hypothetical protein